MWIWLNFRFVKGNLKHKKGEPIPVNQCSDLMTPRGLIHNPTKLRFENSSNKKTLKQAFLELVYFN
jgi:hypothetical protein